MLERSPESARLIVLASIDFLSDRVTETVSAVGGSGYLAPYQFVANAVDAALDDSGLSGIRAHGAFNRTLDPMNDAAKRNWEILNYALVALAILAVYGVSRAVSHTRERRQLAWLERPGGTTPDGRDTDDGAVDAAGARA